MPGADRAFMFSPGCRAFPRILETTASQATMRSTMQTQHLGTSLAPAKQRCNHAGLLLAAESMVKAGGSNEALCGVQQKGPHGNVGGLGRYGKQSGGLCEVLPAVQIVQQILCMQEGSVQILCSGCRCAAHMLGDRCWRAGWRCWQASRGVLTLSKEQCEEALPAAAGKDSD